MSKAAAKAAKEDAPEATASMPEPLSDEAKADVQAQAKAENEANVAALADFSAAIEATKAEAVQPWRELVTHMLGYLEAHPYVVGVLQKEMAARGLRL